MRLSHSKLDCILTCPMSYYLKYKQGITPKEKKKALAIGSAVHWGIEHNTCDLEEFYNEVGSKFQKDNYTEDQVLAESMVYGYLKNKDKMFEEILKDNEDNSTLELLDEAHELELTGYLKSNTNQEPHEFFGIIDLLLTTNKGFILLDYKTSSSVPDWDKYLDQIYRYIFLLNDNFPGVPIIKIGIINLRKTKIRQKKNESQFDFINRLKAEYSSNVEDYIDFHIYEVDKLNQEKIKEYLDNLSRMSDMAELIDTSETYYINYNNCFNVYGKSDYADIFYNEPQAYLNYEIKDTIYDDNNEELLTKRDCIPLDMKVINNKNVLNHYEQFKMNAISQFSVNGEIDENKLFDNLKKLYLCDDTLLKKYWDTFMYEVKNKCI